MGWHESSWRFATSEGGELTAALGVAAGMSVGSFHLEHRFSHEWIELKYNSLGVGGGLGLDGSGAFGTRDMPSVGIGNILTKGTRRQPVLLPRDFTGFFMMTNAQAGIIGGGTLSTVYFNVPPKELLFNATGFGMAANALTAAATLVSYNPLPDSAKAIGMIAASSVGLQIGFGGMFYYGYLELVPQRSFYDFTLTH